MISPSRAHPHFDTWKYSLSQYCFKSVLEVNILLLSSCSPAVCFCQEVPWPEDDQSWPLLVKGSGLIPRNARVSNNSALDHHRLLHFPFREGATHQACKTPGDTALKAVESLLDVYQALSLRSGR